VLADAEEAANPITTALDAPALVHQQVVDRADALIVSL